MIKLTCEESFVRNEDGTVDTEVSNIKEIKTRNGDMLRWSFAQVGNGGVEIASGLTNIHLTEGGKLWNWIRILTGERVDVGKVISNLEKSVLGKKCKAVVERAEVGDKIFNRVEKIFPIFPLKDQA